MDSSRHDRIATRTATVFGAGMLLLALAAGALAADATRESSPPTVSDDGLKGFVAERIDEWWPTPEEKRFDEIGWAADLREARRLAREHGRPVFLFTMDGRVNTGRC